MKTLLTLLLLTLSLPSFAQNPAEIITKMEDRMRGESAYMELEMTIVRPKYTRTMAMKSWSLGQDYSLIFLTAPAKDKGTAFLKREREIWNWVPTIERMIKLPPSMMSQSWMGSDFTNDDLVRETSMIDDYTYAYLGNEDVGGFSCHKIEMIPKPEAAVIYEKVLVWVEVNEFFQMRAENFDEYGDLANHVEFSDVKVLGGRRLPTTMTLIPADKPGNQTVITYKAMEFNTPIEKSFFSIQQLKRLR